MLKQRRWRNAAQWLTLIAFLHHTGPSTQALPLPHQENAPRVPTGHLVGTFCHPFDAKHQNLASRADKAENSS